LASDTKYSEDEINELKFEYIPRDSKDSDKKFTISIKNLLILIKDFYGADDAIVYWFNLYKKSFKLLASSEDGRSDNHKERFDIGNDYISRVCLNKKSEIANINSEQDKKLINHFKQSFNIKSIIANPLIVDDEVLAVVLCESKTLNFFGTPNLYTLQVFSESITNYIKYYSLNEDFEYEDDILKLLAANKVKETSEIIDIIQNSFVRYIEFESLAVITNKSGRYEITRFAASEGSKEINKVQGKELDRDSLAYRSIINKKVVTYNFLQDGSKTFRYLKDEAIDSFTNFCSIPFILDGQCLGIIAFDTRQDVFKLQSKLSNVYKLILPLFLYMNVISYAEGAHTRNFVDEKTSLYNKEFFVSRLTAELNKCRLFNESNFYCIYTCIDNLTALQDAGINRDYVEKVFSEELKAHFKGFDMIFKVDDNKYGIIANVGSEEKLFIEFEKMRKSISANIFKKEGKDINFTVSFAIKKYEDYSQPADAFLTELENVLKLAKSEGGNIVKI
jgi:GGDEF domain-containing protein